MKFRVKTVNWIVFSDEHNELDMNLYISSNGNEFTDYFTVQSNIVEK